MQVLRERKLELSGKKTRIGTIDKGFHFLGIQYPETQPLDNTNGSQDTHGAYNQASSEQNISSEGGGDTVSIRRASSPGIKYHSSSEDFEEGARAS
jgi:hypothetical protein